MAVNLIVAGVTLAMAGFALAWLLRPDWRTWVEAPKYRVLSWDRDSLRKPDRVASTEPPREDPRTGARA